MYLNLLISPSGTCICLRLSYVYFSLLSTPFSFYTPPSFLFFILYSPIFFCIPLYFPLYPCILCMSQLSPKCLCMSLHVPISLPVSVFLGIALGANSLSLSQWVSEFRVCRACFAAKKQLFEKERKAQTNTDFGFLMYSPSGNNRWCFYSFFCQKKHQYLHKDKEIFSYSCFKASIYK